MKHLTISKSLKVKVLSFLLLVLFSTHTLTLSGSYRYPLPSFSCDTENKSKEQSFSDIIIVWNETVSAKEASGILSGFSEDILLSYHEDNISFCSPSKRIPTGLLMDKLKQHPLIRSVEQDSEITLSSISYPEYFDTQWYLNNSGQYSYLFDPQDFRLMRSSSPDVDINLPEALELLPETAAKKNVTVAIIDTGVDITHPALSEHIYRNEREIPDNGIDDDGNGFVDDINGWDFYHEDKSVFHYSIAEDGSVTALKEDNDTHGTHCAGIIASSSGVLGVASSIDIKIMPLKIHGGPNHSGSITNAIRAIKYAEKAGADICNLSWGTSVYSDVLETAMRESSMLFVVAAGNNGTNNNAVPMYPANFELSNMISVAFIDAFGNLSENSNYGVSTVDIAAPGQDIYSTGVGGSYLYQSGSSMASPVVAGTAALLYACSESPYPQNIKEVILQTRKPLPSLENFVRYPGIPDVAAALKAKDLILSDSVPPTVSPTSGFHGAYLAVELNPEDLGGSQIRFIAYSSGAKPLTYFEHGTSGISVSTDGYLSLSKAGKYTFYISDYAGNETIYTYTVIDDITPPSLFPVCKKMSTGEFKVTVNANDPESGVKRIRYLVGTHNADIFLSGGHDLLPSNQYTFLANEGIYTLYAIDNRGNKTIYNLEVKEIPASQIFLSATEIELSVGDIFSLCPVSLPLNNSEALFIQVTDSNLLFADSNGTITAKAPGTASVIVSSESGLKKSCVVHIKEKEVE